MLFREATFDMEGATDDSMECKMAFSSECPVMRTDWETGKSYREILSHERGAVDLARLNNRHPLLVNHNSDDQVGVVKSATIDADKKGRATVRFSKSARGKEIWQDVKDGIRGLVSVGYRVGKEINRSTTDGVETRSFEWMPYELSLVPIPADNTVGVGRNAPEADKTETKNLTNKINMSENTNTPPVIDEAKLRAEGGKAETKRVNEILEVGRKFNAVEDAQTFIRDGKTTEDFYRHITENKLNAKPINATGDIGMSQKEARQFSLVRAIGLLAEGKRLDGIEKEASDAVAKLSGRAARGFFIPNEVANLQRDLSSGTSSAGGYTVQTNVLGSSLIELLRNQTVVKELGARFLGGLQGNVAIPSQSGGATAYWVSENGQTTKTALTFGQVSLSPHRLSAVSALSKELIAQSSVDVEGLVREDFARILAIAIDAAALNGSGSSNQPTGVLNTSSIGSVTFGAAATWAKMIDFETQVANANALNGNPAYVISPNTRAKLKAAAKIGSTYPTFIYEDGNINGYKTATTLQCSSDKVYFGNWNDLIIADWVGMDVVVDPYSLADQYQIKITVNMLADIGVRHAGSFCVSTDSGAQ